MKVPLSWLKEFIPIKDAAEKIADSLTLSGLEVDSIENKEEDFLFEISLTPNLAHAASVLGVARELGAILDEKIRLPVFKLEEKERDIHDKIAVHVENTKAAPRYACRLIENVSVKESPDWLQKKLRLCNVRSVNNVVDITNYIMLELGLPMHAFDYDTLSGAELCVRNSRKGEKISTLDGKEYFPSQTALLICDHEKPVALAGIIGSAETEITSKTKNVLIEAAFFDPKTIRKTATQLEIRTEASYRFERGTDPLIIDFALDRAAYLIQKICGGDVLKAKIDIKSENFVSKEISCRLSRTNQILGTQLAMGEMETIFRRLNFSICKIKPDSIEVKAPSYRHDIEAEIDLIEEIARIYGFDNLFKKEKPSFRLGSLSDSPVYVFEKHIRQTLLNEGLEELLTCDLISSEEASLITPDTFPARSMISLLNPSSSEQSILRPSLLPGLLKVVKYNIDHESSSLSGFEIGRTHFKSKDSYLEPSVVALILTGRKNPFHWTQKNEPLDFFDLKGIIENLLCSLKIENFSFFKSSYKNFHPGRQSSIRINDSEAGILGEVNPLTLRKMDLDQSVFYAELNLDDLRQHAKWDYKFKELAQYPSSQRDLTLTVHESLEVQGIIDFITSLSSPLLESSHDGQAPVQLRDVFTGEKLGIDKKNVTLRFIYRDSKKTISIQEVENEHNRIAEAVSAKLKEDGS